MGSFKIMTDSTANLPHNMIDAYDIEVLSYSLFVDDEEYKDYIKGAEIDYKHLYSLMREKKNVTTTLINSDTIYNAIKVFLEKGQDVLYVNFSSGLSGTYNALMIAIEDLREEFPDRKIYGLDSLSAALGQGLLVKLLVEKRKEGKNIDEVYEWGLKHRFNICHEFTVDDLFFLKRGGRISQTTAVVGSALNVKPILHMDDEGHLINIGKVRGRKKSLDTLCEKMEKNAINPQIQTPYIIHGDCLEDAEYLAERIKERLGCKDALIQMLDPVIGSHSGPGTVSLFYYGNKR